MLELASRTLARPCRATLPGSQAPRPWPALADERTKNGSPPDPPPLPLYITPRWRRGRREGPGCGIKTPRRNQPVPELEHLVSV